MNLLRKLQRRKTPPGREWVILRLLPKITFFSSLIPLGLAIFVRVLPSESGVDKAKQVMSMDIFAIAFAITFFTAVLTVALGAYIVHIMKGPVYVADAYPVQHADEPDIKGTRTGE